MVIEDCREGPEKVELKLLISGGELRDDPLFESATVHRGYLAERPWGGMSNGPGIGTSNWAVDGPPRCDINH